jgi:hypothetical protein
VIETRAGNVPRLARASRVSLVLAFALAVAVCAIFALTAPLAHAATTGASGATGATGASGATGATGSTGASGAPAANPSISLNWAGYAVRTSASVRHFRHISGSWVAPSVTCTPGASTYSAFWVGLGGLSQSSNALEQTGTEADCDSNGVAHYSAWYEIVPAPPVTVPLHVSAGDQITGAVTVKGAYVTVKLVDATTGASFSKRLHYAHPDTSSAEWIAEAPSSCSGNSCVALPLSDFGTVQFTDATVRTRSGLNGSITDPRWSAQAIALDELSNRGYGAQVFGPRSLVTAAPTVLSSAGTAFAVNWSLALQQAPGGPGGRFFPGFGT